MVRQEMYILLSRINMISGADAVGTFCVMIKHAENSPKQEDNICSGLFKFNNTVYLNQMIFFQQTFNLRSLNLL